MIKLPDYFVKPYDRVIETVIMADDQNHIYDEVSEYVVTHDISNKISDFFEAYRDKGSTNGVWISGFFGSGKSHLLKILSYVLENKHYDQEKLGEMFASKIKEDAKLKADILQSIEKYKSESILFNIDQQAQITNKNDPNALLQVFYKVFYDHQGFYGFQPHIAEFESYLSKENKFDDFKIEFNNNFARKWEEARIDYVDPLFNEALEMALGKIYGVDASKYEDYLDQWENKHKASIENFADKVAEYISTKGKNFRLNFFIDEVGQYVAENTKLMLNLQTIAESLNTKCNGNSWVFVTSQTDLEGLIGDDRHIQKDDFSKIQGRFSNRIPLTSSNVDEVIERRLLEKNEKGKDYFGKLYDKENANLKTLLSFSEVGMQFKLYSDQQDFVNKYPFVPYQFDLFQQCIKSLSRHNVFQGKHASVGERSMLGVFQQVLKGLGTFEEGDLATFDAMFEGIVGTLRPEAQNAISLANSQLKTRNPLAIRILKTLFLIKYFDGFKATTRNIQILLTGSVNIQVNDFQKKVEEALNLLEEETYIQRRGDIYEYLTNEEKDIEEEIKDLRIEDDEISKYLGAVIFDGILKDTKIKYQDNKQDFEFARFVDGLLLGRPQELQLSFITSDYPEYSNDSHFSAKTIADQTLMMVRLPEEKRFISEVRMHLKTANYIRKNNTSANSDSYARILREKGSLNSQRNRIIQETANDLIARAQIFINGSESTKSSSSDARTRIVDTFQDLIKVAYPKLDLLGNAILDEAQLNLMMSKSTADNLFGGDDTLISAPEQQVLNYINRRKSMNERTTLTDVRNHFNGKPFGWRMVASFCILAQLFKRGKIEAKQNTNTLEDRDLAMAFNNNQQWNNTLVIPQQDIDGTLLRKVKDLHKDLFHDTNVATEAKEIAKNFKEKARELDLELQNFLNQTDTFPFLQTLKSFQDKIKGFAHLDYSQLINSVKDYEDDLLDFKEDVFDRIRAFMNSDQVKIYKNINLFLNENSGNLHCIEKEKEIAQLHAVKNHDAPYMGDQIRLAKEAMDVLSKRILAQQEEERTKTLEKLSKNIQNLKAEKDFSKLNDTQKDQVLRPFEELTRNANKERFISNLKDFGNDLSDLYTKQLNLCVTLANPSKEYKETKEDSGDNSGENPVPKVADPHEFYITLSNTLKKVNSDVSRLESEEDVEHYLAALKTVLLDQLKQNRKINLN